MIGHTSVVNCLSKAGYSKDEEYIVSSSENGFVLIFKLKINWFYSCNKF